MQMNLAESLGHSLHSSPDFRIRTPAQSIRPAWFPTLEPPALLLPQYQRTRISTTLRISPRRFRDPTKPKRISQPRQNPRPHLHQNRSHPLVAPSRTSPHMTARTHG